MFLIFLLSKRGHTSSVHPAACGKERISAALHGCADSGTWACVAITSSVVMAGRRPATARIQARPVYIRLSDLMADARVP